MGGKRFVKLSPLAALALVTLLVVSSGAVATPASGSAPIVPGQLIVALTPGANASEVARDHGVAVAGEVAGGRFFVFGVAPGQEGGAAGALNSDARVAFAEPNWLRQLHDAPNDDGYSLKWDLHNNGTLCDGSDCATADVDMDWQEAYTLLGSGFSGSAVVAVIDTGVDLSHPDLNDKTVAGHDYLSGDADPTDTYGHGTHVAGIAMAETNNAVGTSGVGYSPNIKVMPLRVCDENGCPTSAIVNAIYHAADSGANVINLSLGGPFASSSEEQAVNYAWSKGLVIAASSGNDGAGRVSYPAAFANAIAVGSTNWRDQLAPYSNKGRDLDVVAPGGDMDRYHDPGGIYSTMPTYDVYLTTNYGYNKDYDQLQGTSMAAPQVSGLAALLFAVGVADTDGDGAINDEIRGIIESTADDLGGAGWDRDYGWGRINVNSAVLAAGGGGNNPPSVTITSPADGSTFDSGATIDFAGTASDSEDGDITASLVWTSSIDGQIGTGGNVSISLSDGTHTITASATDSGGKTGSDSISITVGTPPPEPTAVSVSSIAYATEGGKNNDKHLRVIVALVDDLGNPVSGASVSIRLDNTTTSQSWTGSGTTGTDGTVTFSLKNAPSGCYTTTVTDVTAAGLTWDGITPANEYCK